MIIVIHTALGIVTLSHFAWRLHSRNADKSLRFPVVLRTIGLTRGSVTRAPVTESHQQLHRHGVLRRLTGALGLPLPAQEKAGSYLLTVGKNPTTLLPAPT